MPRQSLTEKFSKITYTSDQIQARVRELADQIVQDYAESDRPLVFITIMSGAMSFCSDLTRAISDRMHLVQDFMVVKSYDGQNTTGNVKVLFDHRSNIKDCDVIVVEDIVDTGLTIKAILNILEARKPSSIKICTMFEKSERRLVADLELDYVGFPIEDYFIVGYGMDEDEAYRHLPFTAMLK